MGINTAAPLLPSQGHLCPSDNNDDSCHFSPRGAEKSLLNNNSSLPEKTQKVSDQLYAAVNSGACGRKVPHQPRPEHTDPSQCHPVTNLIRQLSPAGRSIISWGRHPGASSPKALISLKMLSQSSPSCTRAKTGTTQGLAWPCTRMPCRFKKRSVFRNAVF